MSVKFANTLRLLPSDGEQSRESIPHRMFAPRLPKTTRAGVTLVESVVALMVIVIGFAGLFATSAQCYALLRRSKENVAVREDILCRLDAIRTLSYTQLAKSNYLNSTLLVSGTAGD